MTGPDIGASIRARLLNKAKTEGQDFNLVVTRYALERLLYRLGSSSHAERLLLKGALLFDLWFDIPHRLARDVDLLGFGLAEIPIVEAIFRDLDAGVSEPDDGIRFQAETVRGMEIRKEANDAGIRVTLVGLLAGARCPVEVDVGFGDAVTPAPPPVDYPVMRPELPAPRLRAYPRYTVVAEKLDALVTLGIANSRMKDALTLSFATSGSWPARRTSTGTFSPRRSAQPSTGAQHPCPMAYPSVSPKSSPKTARSRPSGGHSSPRTPSSGAVCGCPGPAARLSDATAACGGDGRLVDCPMASRRWLALTAVVARRLSTMHLQQEGLLLVRHRRSDCLSSRASLREQAEAQKTRKFDLVSTATRRNWCRSRKPARGAMTWWPARVAR